MNIMLGILILMLNTACAVYYCGRKPYWISPWSAFAAGCVITTLLYLTN